VTDDTKPDLADEGPAVRRLLDSVRHAGFVAGYDAAKAEVLRLLRERWLAVSEEKLFFTFSDATVRAYVRRALGEATNKVEGLSVKPWRRQAKKGG
jgi:hypothetical protein